MGITVEKDFVCKVDCHISPKDGKPYCCGRCFESRKYFITDLNRHLWTDNHGFWSETGCRLKREDMPKECREYDCHGYTFIGFIRFIDDKWQLTESVELLAEEIMPVKMAVNMTIDKRGNSS
jgi:hypothetical protein